ncbi:MAG: WXG100 family type VII secretion target [Dermatophilaceae bacterium]
MGLALGPDWVDAVHPPFRSAATSIEGQYRTLDGDPVELERTAASWYRDADRLDGVWDEVDRSRRSAEDRWIGRGADGYQDRAREWVAEVATSATSLRFAAEGLEIIAAAMSDAQRRSDGYIRWYVETVNREYEHFRSMAPVAQNLLVARMKHQVDAVGWATIQAVHAQAGRLDQVLASAPRRFVVGPGAPWRSGVSRVATDQRSGSWSGMLTIPIEGSPVGLRVTRSEGMVVTQDTDGRIVIGLRDSYGLGPHASGGSKTNFDELPRKWQDKLNRAYGEIEASAAVGYVKRYSFSSVDDAQDFVDDLHGTTITGRLAAFARDAAGFYAGPAADLGPLHDRLTGREPDETAISVSLTAKGSLDAGLQPVLADRASASGAVSGVYTSRANGATAVGWLYETEQKTGLTAGYDTTLLGGSRSVLHRTDYSPSGEPTQYLRQVTTVGDYDHHLGTNGSYVGVQELPGGIAGGHVKGDIESAVRRVETTTLDLDEPENRAVFDAAGAGPPGSAGDVALRERLATAGVETVREYDLDRQVGEGSGKIFGFGAKAGPQVEQQHLVDSWYVDPEGDHRPVPVDPRLPGAGLIDVLDPDEPTG